MKGCDFRFKTVEDVRESVEKTVDEQAKQTRFKANILNLFSSDTVMYLGKLELLLLNISNFRNLSFFDFEIFFTI